jgi:hypothetical protein
VTYWEADMRCFTTCREWIIEEEQQYCLCQSVRRFIRSIIFQGCSIDFCAFHVRFLFGQCRFWFITVILFLLKVIMAVVELMMAFYYRTTRMIFAGLLVTLILIPILIFQAVCILPMRL